MATTTTTTGINVNGIVKIKAAINNYQKKINIVASQIGAKKALIHQAIQGDNSVKNLELELNRIETKIKELVKELDNVATNLDTIKSAYQKNDSGNTSFYQKPQPTTPENN